MTTNNRQNKRKHNRPLNDATNKRPKTTKNNKPPSRKSKATATANGTTVHLPSKFNAKKGRSKHGGSVRILRSQSPEDEEMPLPPSRPLQITRTGSHCNEPAIQTDATNHTRSSVENSSSLGQDNQSNEEELEDGILSLATFSSFSSLFSSHSGRGSRDGMRAGYFLLFLLAFICLGRASIFTGYSLRVLASNVEDKTLQSLGIAPGTCLASNSTVATLLASPPPVFTFEELFENEMEDLPLIFDAARLGNMLLPKVIIENANVYDDEGQDQFTVRLTQRAYEKRIGRLETCGPLPWKRLVAYLFELLILLVFLLCPLAAIKASSIHGNSNMKKNTKLYVNKTDKKKISETVPPSFLTIVDQSNHTWNANVQKTKASLIGKTTEATKKPESPNNDNKKKYPRQTTVKDKNKTTTTKKKNAVQVATALGDILVERLLQDHPEWLQQVSIEQWEILLALPISVLVELLEIVDGRKEDDGGDEKYDWEDIWSHVGNYHRGKTTHLDVKNE